MVLVLVVVVVMEKKKKMMMISFFLAIGHGPQREGEAETQRTKGDKRRQI